MATIVDLARPGHLKTGSLKAGKWRAEERIDTTQPGSFSDTVVRDIYHYGTKMLTYRVVDPRDLNYLDYSIGHGSVSDQMGMNRLFQALNIPLYFSRAGGAEIAPTSNAPEDWHHLYYDRPYNKV